MIGVGVLKGMAVTLRQFVGTYPAGRVLLKVLRLSEGDGICTVSYPDTKQQHAERFRYFPFLVYDGTPENLRCVACRICEQECPPQCIYITMAKDEQNRPLKAHGRTFPVQFDIDVAICMSCRICVDVCPFEAIEMDNQHEISTQERSHQLVYDKSQLLRSAEYFQQIKPTEAADVNARLAAKAAKTQPPKPAAPAAGAAATPPA